MAEASLADYARTLTNEIQTRAEADDGSIPKTFTRYVLEILEEGGFVSNTTVAYHDGPGVMIFGYGYSDDGTVLDLYTTDFSLTPTVDKLTKTIMDRQYRRLLAFLRKADSIQDHFDPTTEIHQLCEGVGKALVGATRIRLFLLSNYESSARSMPGPQEFDGLPVEHHLWDLGRLYRHETSGTGGEPIVVEFDPPLPCLSVQSDGSDLSVALAVVPGRRLAELYEEHRTRLLELNVRAFLQARGKVNGGIRKTLREEPGLFLAYNNGITATALEAEFEEDANGNRTGIRRLIGLQIVNGGQTTATLHHVLTRDKNDLSGVSVQMKLTLVPAGQLMEMVPRISEYSNTQNKVTLVDFSSNDKFHVDFERISRTLWAPSVDGSGPDTRWWYERARGSYAVEEAKYETPAAKKKFKLANPTAKRFTKSDLAKYVNLWNSLPYWVARGAQKNFAEFQMRVKETPPIVDAEYCRRVIAMGILFKEVDKVAKAHGAGSQKAVVTAYTMARLCEATERRIDLDRIWREQTVSAAVVQAVDDLCSQVKDTVIQEGRLATEWGKNPQCWEDVRAIDWQVPDELAAELLDRPVGFAVDTQEEDEEHLARLQEIPPAEWHALADWARETRRMELKEQQAATAAANKLETGAEIAPYQVRQALAVYEKAVELGFGPEDR
ncbi:abortive phage resistance protein [Streptomyces sp. SCUT-3]|uniref:AIPR family protein n=1 Tax=Streptomyces sp. SCUT-3 TaxID=2684469 RepID=UPI000CC0D8AA|nr:AIPR family protein [Streptomyces sp. SCUT-3]PLW72999.1 abortive phage resistance protein [Streptomyces sp. DJ]QMV24172.1 abortive phage resistance protein [Streptomyces sp. SCUT-3]